MARYFIAEENASQIVLVNEAGSEMCKLSSADGVQVRELFHVPLTSGLSKGSICALTDKVGWS